MAVDYSQTTMTKLSDNTVSRLMAEKALHDQGYRELLLEYISLPISFDPLRAKDKIFETLFQSIRDFRQQLVDEAKVEAPRDSSGHRRELSTYLKQVLHSRVLVPNHRAHREGVAAEMGNKEWGWVVSRQVRLTRSCKLTLDLGTSMVHCTLGFVFLTSDPPIPSRPFSISI